MTRFWVCLKSIKIYTTLFVGVQKCLRFHYNMSGQTVGKLNVLLSMPNGSEEILWSRTGNQGLEWKQATIAITTEANKKVQVSYLDIKFFVNYSLVGVTFCSPLVSVFVNLSTRFSFSTRFVVMLSCLVESFCKSYIPDLYNKYIFSNLSQIYCIEFHLKSEYILKLKWTNKNKPFPS